MGSRDQRRQALARMIAALAGAALCVLAWSHAGAQSASPGSVCDLHTDDRVVAVGDIHGAFDQFTAILREAGLIDGRRRWIGGAATLVQLGDILDRGSDSKQVIDLLRKLSDEAAKAGGRVHALLGNHETMRMMGDYRYVSRGEYAAFRSPDAEMLRDRYYTLAAANGLKQAQAAGATFDESAFRKTFLAGTPLGYVEMQLAFAATGDHGRWLRDRDVMVRINGVVFVHGGTSRTMAALGCETINARARAELAALVPGARIPDDALVADPNGPLWYRGLVDEASPVPSQEVTAILQTLSARAIVVGHTSVPTHKILVSQEGRVVQVDTGMLGGTFYPGGVPAALEIRGGTWTAVYEGGRRESLRVAVPQG
jgi:hypothetical protein